MFAVHLKIKKKERDEKEKKKKRRATVTKWRQGKRATDSIDPGPVGRRRRWTNGRAGVAAAEIESASVESRDARATLATPQSKHAAAGARLPCALRSRRRRARVFRRAGVAGVALRPLPDAAAPTPARFPCSPSPIRQQEKSRAKKTHTKKKFVSNKKKTKKERKSGRTTETVSSQRSAKIVCFFFF